MLITWIVGTILVLFLAVLAVLLILPEPKSAREAEGRWKHDCGWANDTDAGYCAGCGKPIPERGGRKTRRLLRALHWLAMAVAVSYLCKMTVEKLLDLMWPIGR